MLNRLPIRLRIQLGFILVLLIGIGALLPQFLNTLGKQSDFHESLYIQNLQASVQEQIDNQLAQALNLAAAVASQPSVQYSFAQRDRLALREELLPTFAYLEQNAGIEQMQFHLAPAISFLRLHDPDNHGDDLSSFRHTVVETNRQQQQISGLESGVAGLGIRGVVPVFWEGKHLGSFEMGMSMRQSFVDTFKANHNADIGILRPDGNGFKPLITTWQGQNIFSTSDLQQVMDGQTISQTMSRDGYVVAAMAAPLKDFSGKIIGAVAVYTDRSQSAAAFNKVMWQTIGMAVIILLAGLAVAMVLALSITRPLNRLLFALRDIAEGEQDLRRRLKVEGADELGQVASLFNTFMGKVENTVLQVLNNLGELGSKTQYSSRLTSEALAVARTQQDKTQEVSAAMNEMSATAMEIAQNAVSTAEATEQVESSSVEGSRAVNDGSQAMLALADNVLQASTSIQTLDEYSQNIGSILDVITAISEQTNLLALNAAIEAARAGEHGRGFAVVADEVRGLAQRSKSATSEIHEMIVQLQQGVAQSVALMEQSQEQATSVAQSSEAMQAALNEITSAISRVSDMSSQIAAAAEEQTTVSEDINRNLVAINDGAVVAVDHSANISVAASDMGSSIGQLMSDMRAFKVNIPPKVELAMAKSAHQAWRVRIRSFLDGHSSLNPGQATSHTECDLGIWCATNGQQFNHLRAFQELEQPHARMHQLILRIIEAKQKGQQAESEQMYEEVEILSEQIIGLLDQLIHDLG